MNNDIWDGSATGMGMNKSKGSTRNDPNNGGGTAAAAAAGNNSTANTYHATMNDCNPASVASSTRRSLFPPLFFHQPTEMVCPRDPIPPSQLPDVNNMINQFMMKEAEAAQGGRGGTTSTSNTSVTGNTSKTTQTNFSDTSTSFSTSSFGDKSFDSMVDLLAMSWEQGQQQQDEPFADSLKKETASVEVIDKMDDTDHIRQQVSDTTTTLPAPTLHAIQRKQIQQSQKNSGTTTTSSNNNNNNNHDGGPLTMSASLLAYSHQDPTFASNLEHLQRYRAIGGNNKSEGGSSPYNLGVETTDSNNNSSSSNDNGNRIDMATIVDTIRKEEQVEMVLTLTSYPFRLIYSTKPFNNIIGRDVVGEKFHDVFQQLNPLGLVIPHRYTIETAQYPPMGLNNFQLVVTTTTATSSSSAAAAAVAETDTTAITSPAPRQPPPCVINVLSVYSDLKKKKEDHNTAYSATTTAAAAAAKTSTTVSKKGGDDNDDDEQDGLLYYAAVVVGI